MVSRWFLAAIFGVAFGCSTALAAEGSEADSHDHPPATAGQDEADHGAESGGVKPLGTDPDLAVWTLIVFVCLLLLLKKVAWGPIVQALDARENNITANIAAADAKHEEAKTLLAEHQAKVDAAAEEVRGMLEEARRDAEAAKAAIVAEARQAADAERQRALRDIEQAKDTAVSGLAEESAKLAVDLAAKVVRQEISQERQGEIIREALGMMGASNN